VKSPRLRSTIAACLAAALAAAVAPWREARGAPCTASVEEARRHMDRGLYFFDHKRFVEAATEFDAAYQAQPYSAFLCNAAMAYTEALDFPKAIARYKAFLAAEPNPPDLKRIKTMLAWLEAQQAARERAYGADAGAQDASDAGAALPVPSDAGASGSVLPPPAPTGSRSIRSQVVIESQPSGAPLTIYARRQGAPPFVPGSDNAGWEKVASGVKTPYDISLAIGDYHIVLDSFEDYRRSEADLSLSPGRVYNFKANLSQGAFLGFLRVSSPVEGARIFLDDPPPHPKGSWGRTPHGDMVEPGPHRVWIEAPGFEPYTQRIMVEHGKTVEVAAKLDRVPYGYLLVDGDAERVSVKIDGVPYGNYVAPGEPLKIKLPAGRHRVELDASGRKAFSGEVEVPKGREVEVHGRLSFSPPRASAVISGTLAVGAAVGAVFLLQQPSTRFVGLDYQSRPILVPSDAQPWFKIGGFVSLGVSGLLAFATAYTLLHDPNPPSRARVEKPHDFEAPKSLPKLRLEGVTPTVGPQGAGLTVQGSF